MRKYHNKKIEVDGITFDSMKEAKRYYELKQLESVGVIDGLLIHPKFELQESFVNREWGKQRPITYSADFIYQQDDQTIVEDVKGMKTDVYKLKKKLFLKKYPDVIFREV